MTNIPVIGSFVKLAMILGGSLLYTIAWIAYRLLRIIFRTLQSVLVALAFGFLGAAYFNATKPATKARIGGLMQRVVGETPKSERKSKTNAMIARVRAGGKNPRAKVYDQVFGR